MNKTQKIVWNHSCRAFIVSGEKAKAQGRSVRAKVKGLF